MSKKGSRKIRKEWFENPIFVLGLPRSGTSMVAGCLAICGAWTGTTVPGGDANPQGFYEHVAIREQIIKKILSSTGCDPLGVTKLPPVDMEIDVAGLSETIKTIIKKDGYQFDRPWLYKDAKLTLLWPVFKTAFPNAKWVIVRRDEEQFIASCIRTHFMKQHSVLPEYWRNFASEYNRRLARLKQSNARVLEIDSGELVEGNFTNLAAIMDEIGLDFKEPRVHEFILPSYWDRRS